MPKITLPDGSERQYDTSTSGADIAESIGAGLARAAVAVRVDGDLWDLNREISADAEVAIITRDSDDGIELLRHDAAHVLAEAVKELWPETQVTIGPAIEHGFYYDFAREEPFTPEDLPKIEKKMAEIIQRGAPFTKDVWDRDKAKKTFKEMGEVMPGFDAVALMKYPHLERINHIHHAGNSSGIVDGSAAVLIGNKEFGETWGLKPRARIKATAKIGTDPTIMLTGPVAVTEKVLKKAGMAVSDIDLFELNEAFASVVLRHMQAFDIPHDKMNVCGGAIAMGHPLGATGAMILGTVLDELERTGKETALVTLCVGGGMGTATIIERV